MQPLEGLEILDLSTHFPGPFCSVLLQSLGAAVTRVSNPKRPDEAIHFGKLYYDYLSRYKSELFLDLKDEKDREKFYERVKKADGLLHAFRPQVQARLGIEPDRILKLNPRMVYVAISGYPHGSENENRAGHDLNFLALSGMLSTTETPQLPPIPIADICVAWNAALQMVSQFYKRSQSNSGGFINCSIEEAVDLAQGPFLFEGVEKKQPKRPGEYFYSGGYPNYGIFETKDKRHFSVASLEAHFWKQFCELMELPENCDYREKSQFLKIKGSIQAKFKEKTFSEWVQFFQNENICVEPVLSYKDRWSN